MRRFYKAYNPQLWGFLMAIPTISDEKNTYTANNTKSCAVKIRRNMVSGYTVA